MFFFAVRQDILATGSGPAQPGREGSRAGEGNGAVSFADLKRIAYGALALRPREFWDLTVAELSDLAAGHNFRDERQWERMAWVVSHLLNVSGKTVKTRVTPRKLLHRQTSAHDQESWWGRIEAARKAKREQNGSDA